MRKPEINNFELLLMTAAEASANDLADEFMAIDTSNIEMSPKSYAKIQRYIRKYRKHTNYWKPAKVILVACLIAMSVAFTACMIVPQIREAIKNVVVQWYDDYLAINFSDEPSTEMPQPEPAAEIPETPPTTIERKAYATYLPKDYRSDFVSETKAFYQINYVDGAGNFAFMLHQKIITEEMYWNDEEGADAQETKVNGHKAYIITYRDEPNVYTLMWQDYYYQYSLYGYFESQDELMKIAENIKWR